MGIIDNLSDAFHYASEGLVGKWVRWIVLILCSIIFPLIMGYSLRIMKGGSPAPETDNYIGMFIDGIKMIIINIVYMIIPIIIGVLLFILSGGFGSLTMLAMNVTNPYAYLGMVMGSLGISLIVFLILVFIFSLFEIIGVVRFARNGSMGDAFAFGEITGTIGKIGWLNYIVSIIVIGIVIAVIYGILQLIPVIGWLLAFIIMPFLSIVAARYYSLLYDEGI